MGSSFVVGMEADYIQIPYRPLRMTAALPGMSIQRGSGR